MKLQIGIPAIMLPQDAGANLEKCIKKNLNDDMEICEVEIGQRFHSLVSFQICSTCNSSFCEAEILHFFLWVYSCLATAAAFACNQVQFNMVFMSHSVHEWLVKVCIDIYTCMCIVIRASSPSSKVIFCLPKCVN